MGQGGPCGAPFVAAPGGARRASGLPLAVASLLWAYWAWLKQSGAVLERAETATLIDVTSTHKRRPLARPRATPTVTNTFQSDSDPAERDPAWREVYMDNAGQVGRLKHLKTAKSTFGGSTWRRGARTKARVSSTESHARRATRCTDERAGVLHRPGRSCWDMGRALTARGGTPARLAGRGCRSAAGRCARSAPAAHLTGRRAAHAASIARILSMHLVRWVTCYKPSSGVAAKYLGRPYSLKV